MKIEHQYHNTHPSTETKALLAQITFAPNKDLENLIPPLSIKTTVPPIFASSKASSNIFIETTKRIAGVLTRGIALSCGLVCATFTGMYILSSFSSFPRLSGLMGAAGLIAFAKGAQAGAEAIADWFYGRTPYERLDHKLNVQHERSSLKQSTDFIEASRLFDILGIKIRLGKYHYSRAEMRNSNRLFIDKLLGRNKVAASQIADEETIRIYQAIQKEVTAERIVTTEELRQFFEKQLREKPSPYVVQIEERSFAWERWFLTAIGNGKVGDARTIYNLAGNWARLSFLRDKSLTREEKDFTNAILRYYIKDNLGDIIRSTAAEYERSGDNYSVRVLETTFPWCFARFKTERDSEAIINQYPQLSMRLGLSFS